MSEIERKAAGLWPSLEACEKALGSPWVLARRTKRIIEKYGENVRCVSYKEYEKARLRAWKEVSR